MGIQEQSKRRRSSLIFLENELFGMSRWCLKDVHPYAYCIASAWTHIYSSCSWDRPISPPASRCHARLIAAVLTHCQTRDGLMAEKRDRELGVRKRWRSGSESWRTGAAWVVQMQTLYIIFPSVHTHTHAEFCLPPKISWEKECRKSRFLDLWNLSDVMPSAQADKTGTMLSDGAIYSSIDFTTKGGFGSPSPASQATPYATTQILHSNSIHELAVDLPDAQWKTSLQAKQEMASLGYSLPDKNSCNNSKCTGSRAPVRPTPAVSRAKPSITWNEASLSISRGCLRFVSTLIWAASH